MICERCGGPVEWKGPITNLTHTECAGCGGTNCQIAESPEEEWDEDEDPGVHDSAHAGILG